MAVDIAARRKTALASFVAVPFIGLPRSDGSASKAE